MNTNATNCHIVVVDVGSTYTKLTLMQMRDGSLVHLGRSQCPTTVEGIHEGLEAARSGLGSLSPLAKDKATMTLATSSAAGGLRMVAMGYMPKVTANNALQLPYDGRRRVLGIVLN